MDLKVQNDLQALIKVLKEEINKLKDETIEIIGDAQKIINELDKIKWQIEYLEEKKLN